MKSSESLYREAWHTLSRIDVADHIQQRGNFSYLSWPWAWAQLMENYPASTFDLWDMTRPDNTVVVTVKVTVRDADRKASRMMWLPAMDNRNNAIVAPDARAVSDTTMRCLVKCLALFGLGLDIYAGSDLPVGQIEEPIEPDQLKLLSGMYDKLSTEKDRTAYREWLGIDVLADLPKGKYKSARLQLERKIKAQSAKKSDKA